MVKKLGLVWMIILWGMGIGHDGFSFAQQSRVQVQRACFVEAQQGYFVDILRGPSYELYGVKRTIPSKQPMRAFGQDESGEWLHVHLPRVDMVGWVYADHLIYYGDCLNLPVFDGSIELETPPDPPTATRLPAFAQNMRFSEDETLYQLNEAMLYVRHEADTLRAHILIVDLSHPSVHIETDLTAPVGSRYGGLLSELGQERQPFAAINGDFWTPNYMPQNIFVRDGELLTAPLNRATFAITPQNEPYIGQFRPTEKWGIYAENGEAIPLQYINIRCEDEWVCLYTDIWESLPITNGYDGLRILLNPDFEVLSITTNESLEIPPDHLVLRTGANSEAARWFTKNTAVGEKLVVLTETEPAWQNYAYTIGGGPLLVAEGQFWQECDPDLPEEERVCEEFTNDFRRSHYGRTRIPRSAIGYTADQQVLVLIMVEGNRVNESLGITQEELAEMFIRLRVTRAMEFDGGGSAAMWLYRSLINDLDARGERYISSALMIFWEEG